MEYNGAFWMRPLGHVYQLLVVRGCIEKNPATLSVEAELSGGHACHIKPQISSRRNLVVLERLSTQEGSMRAGTPDEVKRKSPGREHLQHGKRPKTSKLAMKAGKQLDLATVLGGFMK